MNILQNNYVCRQLQVVEEEAFITTNQEMVDILENGLGKAILLI